SDHRPTLFSITIPHTPRSTPFPYTTLFRSLFDPKTKTFRPPPQSIQGVQTGATWNGYFIAGSNWDGKPALEVRAFRGADLERVRSEEHTSELQSHLNLVCRLLLEKKK